MTDMTMDTAFKLVLEMANEVPEPWYNDQNEAVSLVTAYYLLRIKSARNDDYENIRPVA